MILSSQPAIHLRIHASGRYIERVSLFLSLKNFTCQILKANFSLQREILKWLLAYARKKDSASLPLLCYPTLSPFHQTVLDFLPRIPFGSRLSYSEVATQLKNAKAFRAVGNACHRNPVPLFIPCHRVTSSIGPGGFASDPEIKKRLLAFEQ